VRSRRAWIRHGSSLLIVGFLAALAVIGYQRTRGDGSGVGSVDPNEVGLDPADIAVGLYRGFQHTEIIDGKTAFILNSIRTLSRASGWQEIEGIRLELFRDGEEGPVLTAESASYNIETHEARLQGGIHVEFPNGAFLNTDSGRFEAKRQVFISEAQVLFVDGATFGQAEQATYDLAKNRVKLDGNAAFRAENGALMTAPRLVYRRDEGRVLFPDGVELNHGLTRLLSPIGNVTLAEEEGPPERIELVGGVEAQTVVESTGALVNMSSQRVVTQRDPAGNWQLRATTDGPWVEITFIGGPNYFERNLQTIQLNAVIGEEGIISLQGRFGVCFEEIPVDGPPRSAASETARAWFMDGQLTDVELDGQVEIRAEHTVARGTRARLVESNGMVMLQGDPTGRSRVAIDSHRGHLSCSQATLFDREDRIEARGKVQGELIDAQLLGTRSTGSVREPVRFAGEVLEVQDGGNLYSLRENARIWQGHRLLLADDIVYRSEHEAVSARGHVRATFPASQMDPAAAPDQDVVVDSRSLDYSAIEGVALFRGSVHYSDPKHSLMANRLSVAFDEQDEISDVEAEGAVEIEDLELGRRLTGRHAIREVASQIITVTGSPAQLTDERGNTASGESLTWNQADGTVSIGGDTELIYYPEETPTTSNRRRNPESESAGSRRP
jgi:lipopolysaccharide export system protein LptA